MSNAKWLNLPVGVYLRRSRQSDTLSCDIDAHSSIALDVAKVEFDIVKGSTVLETRTASARSKRSPNFSDYPSRLPGVPTGTLAPSYCWGTTLVCADLPPGKLEIRARVYYSELSFPEVMPSIYLLNDSDEVDRRYCSQKVYLNAQTGNDANSGSFNDQVQTLNGAIRRVVSNGNCGGGEIVCAGDLVGCGPIFANWTTGDQWLTITFLPGATWRQGSQNYIECAGYGGDGRANLRFANVDFRGLGIVLYGQGYPTSNVTFTVWGEHCEQHSKFWNPLVPWSARHLEDFGALFTFQGVQSVTDSSKTFLTSFLSDGAAYGPAGVSGVYDFIIQNYIGIALQSVGPQQGDYGINGILRGQRSRSQDVKGYINCNGGTLFSVSQPVSGQIKITATGTVFYSNSQDQQTSIQLDIADQLSEIALTDYWWVNLESFGSHSGRHQVLATGHDSGNPFVILEYSGTVTPGTAPAGARLRTIRSTGDPYDPHPDLLQAIGNRQKPFYKNIAPYDINDSQGWFLSTLGPATISDLVLVNIFDGGFRNPMGGSGLVIQNALFENVTFTGSLDLPGSDQVSTALIRDCVFANVNTPPPGFMFQNCHFIGGQTYGTGATSGAFFSTGITPLPAKLNLGTLRNCMPDWLWSGSAPGQPDTQGVWGNVGRLYWGTGNITTGGASSAGSTSTATGTVNRRASGTSTASSTSTASGTRTVTAIGLSFAPSSSTATGLLGNEKSGAGTSSAGSTSAATGRLTLAGTGTSTASSASTATGTVPGQVSGAGASFASSLSSASATVIPLMTVEQAAPAQPETKSDMKQRIFNHLRALLLNGPYHACTINKKTGQMTVDLLKPISPTGIVVKEIRSAYRPAKYLKRDYNVMELDQWSWVAEVEFPNTEVSCESFEQALTDTSIKIPPVIGLDTASQRTLLARLVGCEYTHPPEQSPNVGTVARFSFEIVTDLLRK